MKDMLRLPEECVAQLISLTSPRDACRSEAVSAAFRSAAVSDDVWKRFLPSDYAEILARAVDRVEFASMKHLYFRLCDPILIDGGKMGFFVDRETGAKCFILSARELGIAWGDTPQFWSWIQHPESRFSEVAELMHVFRLEIHGRINSRMLSKRSNYSAYLIYKLSNDAIGFSCPLQEVSITVGAHVSKLSVCLMKEQVERQEDVPEDVYEPQHEPAQDQAQREHEMVGKPQIRQDGWMEIFLGEFYNEEGDDGEVDMSLLEIKGRNWKSGLIVQGIEIRSNMTMSSKMSANQSITLTGGRDRQINCECILQCVVLTRGGRSENRGRQFYRCLKNRSENDCHFFKWMDEIDDGSINTDNADIEALEYMIRRNIKSIRFLIKFWSASQIIILVIMFMFFGR